MIPRRLWRSNLARRGLWALVSLVLVAPLFLAALPPVADYPNHLARAYALARLPGDPVLSQILAPHWRLLPNLALDGLLYPLVRLLPIEGAGRVALAAALLLPLLGATLYNRALFGRPSWWPLGGALFAYNGAFLLGLLNFLFAVAAAFATAALWLTWRERRPVAAVVGTMAGGLVVFFCHVTGLGLLAVLILVYELERCRGPAGRSWRLRAGRFAAAALVFAPAAALYAVSATAGAGGPTFWLWLLKPVYILGALTNYDLGYDLASAVYLLLLLVLALRQRWLVVPRSTAIAVGLLAGFTLLAPQHVKGGAFLDYRFAMPAGLMLFAGARGGEGGWAAARMVAIGSLVGLFALRFALLVDIWSGQRADLVSLESVVHPVGPGSRVLITTIATKPAPVYWETAPRHRKLGGIFVINEHLAALDLIRQGAFFQTFFADPTQQPIVFQPRYRASAPDSASWGVPGYASLSDDDLTAIERLAYPYLATWWQKFDYVLVMNAGALPDAGAYLPRCLELVRAADVAALYRVHPDPGVAVPSDCALPRE